MSAPPRRIEVVIDELVLHGFDLRHRDAVAEALSTELAAALAGWSPAAGAGAAGVAQLDAGSFTVPVAAAPAVLGRGVARQIRQALRAGWPAGTQSAAAQSAGGQQAGGQQAGAQQAGGQQAGTPGRRV